MPVNRFHAFGAGPTWHLSDMSDYANRGFLRSLGARVFSALSDNGRKEILAAFRGNTSYGKNVMVGPGAWCVNVHGKERIRLEDGTVCRGILRVEHFGAGRLSIGDMVYIGDDCIISCADWIEIGRLTLIAHGVQIFDNDSHPVIATEREKDWKRILGHMTDARTGIASAPIRIGERVWIAMNSIILKGVTIGDNSIVTAGSVVISDVPANVIVAGNPAKTVKEL